MKISVKIVIGLLLVSSSSVSTSAFASTLHQPLTKLLSMYVNQGAINYTGLCKDKGLDVYTQQLNDTDPQAISDEKERFAFWLNVYSAYSLQAICQRYPIQSVNDLNPGGLILSVVLKKSVWDKPFVMVNHQVHTLKEVDHEILRPTFKDPRIQFAIACGAIGCGATRQEAYEGSTIDAQLEDQTRVFVNDRRVNSFDQMKKLAVLSPLFKFSAKEFGRNQAEVLLFIAKYLPTDLAQDIRQDPSAWKVKYNAYDLTLNDRKE